MKIQVTLVTRTHFFGNLCQIRTYEVEDEKQAENKVADIISTEVEKQLDIMNTVKDSNVHVHSDVMWREIE